MKLLRERQKLVSNPIADVRAAVREQLERPELKVPQGDVGITAGSRGIANIAEITRATGDWLRDHGAKPFLFPAMGSHNGGTAAGRPPNTHPEAPGGPGVGVRRRGPPLFSPPRGGTPPGAPGGGAGEKKKR